MLGRKEIPADALYGIHAARARENFPSDARFPVEWYKALGLTKLACYTTMEKFFKAGIEKYGEKLPIVPIETNILASLQDSAIEVSEGKYFESFIVPAVQGGAGTSINMNVNEIIANASLIKLGKIPGDYGMVDPIEHANRYQSTNDVVPTALTVAALFLLQILEERVNALRQEIEAIEKDSRNKLRPGFTQMQEAVPSSFGILFSTYNEALSRDWWRVSKCFERIKIVNLGGGATGTGNAVPRFFIMEVVPELRRLTGLPLTHSENLPDATANQDKWVEIHAILKAHAVNLEKIVSDIRLLSSDIVFSKFLSIPPKQVGSSIMPGKINPVIPEFVISASHKIYSNDVLISSLCGQGNLELNAYLPLIGYAVIESLKLLISANSTILDNLVSGLIINDATGLERLLKSPSVTTALIPFTGYNKASDLAKLMKEKGINIIEANHILKIIDEKKLSEILEPGNLLKLGFSITDMSNEKGQGS